MIKCYNKSTSPLQPFSQNLIYANNDNNNNNSNNVIKKPSYKRKVSGLAQDNNTTLRSPSARAYDCNTFTDHVVRVNDANQIRDVLQFILKTFYDAISLQTFVDFTAGELIFDARVT